MFGCIKYSRRRIQPIRVTRKEKSRMIRVVENQDVNSKFSVYLTSENVEDVLRQLKVKETIFDVCEKNENSLSCYLHRDSTEEDIDSQLVHLFNYLSDLFNNKIVTVWIRPSQIGTSPFLFSNLQFGSCQLIKILSGKSDILSNEEEDVKKFINHWMAGSNPKLMHLRLMGFKWVPNWENILEGIDYGVWDEKMEKKRPRNFQNRYIYSTEEIDCKNGLDFERKSDGMIGTVMHHSDQIDFFVWHDIQF
ncbi:hypothetical protein GCK72_003983 [Caenorhabditis remanei]|uniref:Sdz-33 F-box domain-containing protein n=1 Tax=Caenorhabditis remanei TaxID=31234 RepID=A0A6A5HA34_CAERE|nr:hypothetical protein GCK72_003983 [Caenorhabditis remanei]KAF1764037.1 hypothetical protein GCK72_003983 [Caenorhabditis remanei]